MFRAQSAQHQEVTHVNCTYAAPGIVTLCKWPSCATAKEVLPLCIKLVIIKKLKKCNIYTNFNLVRIRYKYEDNRGFSSGVMLYVKFAAYRAFSFITFFHVLLVPFFIIVHTCMVVCFVYFCKLCIFIVIFMYSYCYVYAFLLLCMFCSVYSLFIVLFYVMLVCKCVLYFCHRVSTQLQLTNISYHILNSGQRSQQHKTLLNFTKVRELTGCTNDEFPESARNVYHFPSVHTGFVPQTGSHSIRTGDFPLGKSTWAYSWPPNSIYSQG